MKLDQLLEAQATRLHSYRWLLAAISAAAVVATFVLFPREGMFFRLLDGAAVFTLIWAWGLLLVALWFHPQSGTMRYGSRWWLGLPRAIQTLLRFCGVLFLLLWFLASVPFAWQF